MRLPFQAVLVLGVACSARGPAAPGSQFLDPGFHPILSVARERILEAARLVVAYDVESPSWAQVVGMAADGLNASVGLTTSSRALSSQQALNALNEALGTAYLKRKFSTEDVLVATAVRAIVAGVGDGAIYFTRAEIQRAPRQSSEGSFGLVLGKAQPFPVVLRVEVGSVAEAAFIRAGEEVTGIDGRSTVGHDIHEVRMWLESVIDGNVVLTLADADQTRRTVTLDRSSLSTVGAIGCRVLAGSILYLRIRRFTLSTPSQIREAAQSAGALAQRLILDLRGNPGGDLESAFITSDLLVSDGELGEVEAPRSRVHRVATSGDLLEQGQVAVLVDEGTVGGGELVAANVQDHRRGKVVGRKTPGVADVRQIWPLRSGDAIQIVSRRVLRAGGAPLSGAGVTPDVELTADAGMPRGRFDDLACPGTATGDQVQGDPLVGQAVQMLKGP